MIEVQTEVTAIDPGMTVHPLVGERAGQGVPEGMTTGIKTEIADMVVTGRGTDATMDGVVVTTVTTVGTETDETTEIPETNGETTKIVGTMTATVLGMTEGTETPHVEMLQGTAIEMERMIATVVIIPDRTIDAHQKGAILPSHHEEVLLQLRMNRNPDKIPRFLRMGERKEKLWTSLPWTMRL